MLEGLDITIPLEQSAHCLESEEQLHYGSSSCELKELPLQLAALEIGRPQSTLLQRA